VAVGHLEKVSRHGCWYQYEGAGQGYEYR
jgi:hypothetical protein